MSPEEWLASQPKQSSAQPLSLSPEEWLAKQQPQEQVAKPISPEEWLAKQEGAAPAPGGESFSTLRQVADVPLQTGKGIVSGVRMIADAFGAGSSTSNTLRSVEDYLAGLMSAQSKQDTQEIARIMKLAEDKGVLDQVKAGVQAFTVAPVDFLANALGTAAPAIVASLGATLLGPVGVIAAGAGTGLTMGAGVVKGSIYDAVKNELSKTDMPPDQIEARAQLAQAYNGKNLDMILTGAAIGTLGATTGVEPAIARQIAKGVLTKGAVKEELKNVAEEQLRTAAERGVAKQAIRTGAVESGTEFTQAGQEQLAQNIALQREGFDVPTMRGVVGQATLEGLAGLGLGSLGGGREALQAKNILSQRQFLEDEQVRLEQERVAKEKEAAQAIVPPKDVDALLTSALSKTKKTAEEETFDTLTAQEKAKQIADLEAKINERQPKLDAKTHPNMPAATIEQAKDKKLLADLKASVSTPTTPELTYTDLPSYLAAVDAGLQIKQSDYRKLAKEAGITIPVGTKNVDAIAMLKAKLAEGGQDVTKPIDAAAAGVGAEVLGGPEAGGAPAGITPAGRAGVADTTGAISPIEDRAGAQQPALAQEVIDEQALADQEAKAAAAAEASRLAEEQRLAAEQQAELEAEQAALNEEAAAELAGEAVYEVVDTGLVKPEMAGAVKLGQILTQDEYDAANQEFGEGAFSVEQVTPEVTAPEITAPEATTPEIQTKRDEIVTKVNAFEDIRKLLLFPEKLGDLGKKTKEGVQGDVFKEEKVAKPIKWRGPTGTETENPSPYNFLNKNSYYSDKSPEQIAKQSQVLAKQNKNVAAKDAIEAGVEAAAFDEAYDLYDSIAYEKKVLPEIKQVMAERQTAKNAEIDALNKEREANREAKRAQMTRDGKSEKVIKEALSVIKKVPKVEYSQEKPLEFMSEQEVLDLFKKNIGTKTDAQMAKEGGQARIDAGKDRQAFVNVLSPNDKIKFGMMTEAVLDMEIISAVRDNKVTTAGDRRTEAYRQKQEKKVIKDVKEQLAEAELSVEEIEAREKAKAERIAKRAEERKQERIEVTKEAEAEAKERKSKLVTKIESGIVNDDLTLSKDSILDTIKDRTLNDRMTGTVAAQFLNILTGFPIETKIKFGKLEVNEDGKFDPKTNTITIKGTNKDGYTGARPLAETVMHEVSHATLDHVFDNEAKFIKSVEDKVAKDSARRAKLGEDIKALEAKIRKLKADKKNEEAVKDAIAKLRELRAEFNKPVPLVRDVRAALNRLKQNHKVVLARFGKKYNIESLKEFAAEFWSNSQFQQDLALMASPTPYQPKENFFTTIVKNIANALGISSPSEGTTFKEVAEDLAQLISIPSKGIRGKEVSYAKQAPFLEIKDVYGDNPAFDIPEKIQKTRIKSIVSDIFSNRGAQELIRKLQNNRRALTLFQRANLRAGINQESGPNVNDIYAQTTLALSKALNKYHSVVQQPLEVLQKATVKLSKTKEIARSTEQVNKERKAKNKKELTPSEQTQKVLHMYAQAFTDKERRLNMFVQTAPLSKDKTENVNGVMISPADLRELVFGNPTTKKAGILDTDLNLTEAQARELYLRVEKLVLTTDADGNKVPNTKNVVPGGSSPLGRTAVDFRSNDGNTQYNVTGYTYQQTEAIIADYNADPNKAILDEVLQATYKLNSVAKELNKESYYLSKPAANWIAAYGYERYVPLKGITNHNTFSQRAALNFNGKTLEKELVDIAIKSEGRFSVSSNPILQSMSEAMISTVRAGKGASYTLAIKNAAKKSPKKINNKDVDLNPNGQNLIDAKVVEHIPFNERSYDTIKNVRKDNTILHHNEDGSIDVIEFNMGSVEGKNMLESIRRTYKDQNKILEMANVLTSGLGQMHTRYNINFAPVNFVRDALTNAFNIGATYGASKSFELVANIADQIVTKNSLVKAFKIARAYKTPDFDKFKNSPDPVIRTMYEYIKRGGMVEYLEGISLRSNVEKLNKELTLSKSRIVRGVQGLNAIIDIWTNMFEIASRSAAYGLLKDHFINTEKLSQEAASIRAATAAKNLANFEQVGEYGKAAGAWFMFFRPSATGGVVALDALAPALYNSLDKAVKNAPEYIKNDPKALETFKENYQFQQQASRRMVSALVGIGSLMYIMSYMMSDEDDEGRNKTLTDDMGQWNRFARFHLPGFDKPFLVPWGFGFGAFASMGAQFTAVAFGQQSFGAALKNGITQIALDSFVPLPVSRMDIADDPVMWFADSISPSLFRPVVEFVANKNGLGQSIYNDATGRRMGDAYLGGDHVPETYKIMTRYLAELTEGYIDWTPNTMYFLVNSYADGIGKIIDLMVNNYYFATGERDWDPKTNMPLVGSFIGTPPNVDTREFASVEKQIEDIRATVNMFQKNRPEYYYSTYLPNNPFNEAIVKTYDQNISALNKLRAESKVIRGSDATPAEKKQQLDTNKALQNIIKRNLIETFKSYDIKP